MPTVEELDALDQVAAPAPAPAPRGRRVTVQTLDSLDEVPGLLARAAGAVKGLFEAAVPNPAGLLTAAGKLATPSPAPDVASQAEVRARPPGAFETATGFEAPTAIAHIPTPILPQPEPPPADILPAEEVGRRLAEQTTAERLLPESGVPTREAAAALEAPVPPASAALRAAGSVMVPPRTALETVTQSKPLEAFGVGIGNSIEGLLAKALMPSLHGVGPRDYDPTLLDQAFETVGSLFTPLAVVTFIAGSAPGTIGVKKLAEAAVKRYGPEAVSGALKALGQQVAGAATSFASFNLVQDVLRQTGAVRAGEQKEFKPVETAKEAGKGLVTGAAMGLAGVPITSPLLRKAADIGVLATVPPLLEGRAPGTEDLLNAGVLVGTLTVAHRVTGQAAAALAKVRSARTPAEQAEIDAIPESVKQEIIQEVVAKAAETPPAPAPVAEVRPTGAIILPPERIPATFREYVAAQGKGWPLTVTDPDFLRLRTEYDAIRQPLYEKRGAEVVNKGTGEVVTTLPNGAAAQMEANRLNGARLRAPAAAPIAEVRPVQEVPAQATPAPEAAPQEIGRTFQIQRGPERGTIGTIGQVLPGGYYEVEDATGGRHRVPTTFGEILAETAPPGRIPPGAETQPAPKVAPGPEGPSPQATPAAAGTPIIPAAAGREQQIRVPAGRKYRVRYEIVDAQSLIPSNDPQTFARTPGYPEGVQNRPYETDRAEQAKVISQAQDFEPLFLVSPQPSSGGTPIVAPGANYVLSGNSRTMSLLRTLGTPKYDAYRQALGQIAPAVGITPEQIATVKNPVLVRRLIGEKDTPEFYRRFAKETNESFKQALSQEAAAVSQGQAVSPGTLDYIAGQLDAIGPEATLRQLFGSNRDREIVRRFIQDGVFTGRDVSRYVDARSGLLNDEGKRLVENSLLGSAVPDTMLLQVAPDQALSKIARSLGEIAKVRARGGDWDLSRPLTEALRELTESRAADLPLDEFRRQQSLLEAEPKDPRSGRLADALIDMPPTRFRQAMGGYAADAIRDVAGQQAMRFAAPKGPDQAFAEAFGTGRPSMAPAGALAGVAEPMPPFGAPPVAPKAERVLGEAGAPLSTSPTERALDRTQPLGPQTSTQALAPSEPSLARIPPTVTGLESSSRRVGMLDAPSGTIILQPAQDIKALMAGAADMQAGFEDVLRPAAEAVPGARFVGSRLKSEPRLLQKIAAKGRPADTIPDYLGGRITVDRVEDSQRLLEALNRQGGGVVFDESFFDQPRYGYRARHLHVRLPNGMTAEVQIAPREIQEVQDRAHAQYEVLRDPEASLEAIQQATAEARRIFDEAWARYQERVGPAVPAARPVPGESGLTPGSLILAGREFVARGRAALFGVAEEPPAYAPPFYSQLQRTLEAKLPESSLPGHIRAIAQGAKAEEVKWAGLDDWLAKQPPGQKVTKAQVLEFLRQNEVQVQEVTKGQGLAERGNADVEAAMVRRDAAENDFHRARNKLMLALEAKGVDPQQSAGLVDDFGGDLKSVELFNRINQTLRQGEPQKIDTEFKVMNPINTFVDAVRRVGTERTNEHNTRASARKDVTFAPKFAGYTLPGGKENYRELLLQWANPPEGPPILSQRVRYQPAHWDEPNVLAHVRFDDRMDAEGKRVLFIEELQSDWHQEGRRKGYRQRMLTPEEDRRLSEEKTAILREKYEGQPSREELSHLDARWAELDRILTEARTGVPQAPFAKTWHELALKRMLRWAAEQGYDKLAWTTGDQQAERYDLSKQVKSISYYFGGPEAGYDLSARTNDNRLVDIATRAKPDELSRYVGKDLAEKILRGEGQQKGHPGATSNIWKEFSGLDLKIGGEGMRAFYDQIVPNFLNQYGKKWGARVGTAQLDVIHPRAGERALESVGNRMERLTVPAIDITPAMKRVVLHEGQALFEKPPTYAVREGVKAPEARQLAFEALKDTEQVARTVQSVAGKLEGGVRTLGVGITSDLVMKQRVDLRGRVVKTARDLAQLAQVYRDPRYETFRIFYVDADGKILGHEGITSRLPGSSAGFVGPEVNMEKMRRLVVGPVKDRQLLRPFQEMKERMARLGADGYWLLHNHPSGSPLPSASDGQFSRAFDNAVPGYRGHVVIDSGKYGMLSPAGKRSLGKLPPGTDLLLQPALDSPFLGLPLHNGQQVAALGRRIQSPEGFVTLLYRDGAGRVRAIQEVPEGLFQKPDEMANYLRGRQREFGGIDVLAYAKEFNEGTVASARALIDRGSLLDFARGGGPSLAGQVGQTRNPRATRGIRVEDRYFGLADQAREGFRVEEEKPPTPGREPEDIRPDVFRRLVEVGGAHYEEGAREFPAWAERMKADLGDPIEPYLQRVWDELQREKGRAATPEGTFVPPQGPAEPPVLQEPQLTLGRHKEVVAAATDVLVNRGVERDKSMLLSDQILDLMSRGQLPLDELVRVLDQHHLTLADFGEQMFRPAIADAGRRLQVLSVLERRLNKLAAEAAQAGGKAPEEVERLLKLAREVDEGVRLQSWWRRADNIRRGLLVTQLGTAVRNFETQVGRLGLDVLDAGLQAKLQQLFGRQVTTDPVESMRALAETFRQFNPKNARAKQAEIDAVLQAFPRQWDRLFGSYLTEIQAPREHPILGGVDRALTSAEKAVGMLNVANRFQEYIVRRAVFQETLAGDLRRRGLDLEQMVRDNRAADLPEDALKNAIDHALEITFAERPKFGTIGWNFVRLINQAPFVLTGILPFPRFMWNSLKYLYEFSPLGFTRLLSEAERAKFAKGDVSAISRATLGTAMFLAAYGIRATQPEDTKWYELRIPGGGTTDIRPFNPFAAYFYAAELTRRFATGTLYQKLDWKDLLTGILSVNVRAGLGLFVLDKVLDGFRSIGKTDKALEALQQGAGELLSGFLVPLQQVKDLAGQFDERFRIVRNTREEGFAGPFKAKIPGASEGLIPGVPATEPAYLPTRAEPRTREEPLLRQVTGLIVNKPKNALEQELARFQFDLREIQPSTGDPKADNLIAKYMGQLAEERLIPFVESERYQRLPDAAKANALRLRLRPIRAVAKARARREEPELFKGLKEERRPGRERLYREERQLTREERQAAQPEPEAALVGAGTEEGQ